MSRFLALGCGLAIAAAPALSLAMIPKTEAKSLIARYNSGVQLSQTELDKLHQVGWHEPQMGVDNNSDPADDPYGYWFLDNYDSNGWSFGWIDISGTGTDAGTFGDDGFSGPIPIGFDFPFYDGLENQVWISSNGFISFDDLDPFGYGEVGLFENYSIPDGPNPSNAVYLLWDDLVQNDGHIYYGDYYGLFIVQWQNWGFLEQDPGLTINAEIVLYPNGWIRLQYYLLPVGADLTSNTIGIEDASGNNALQVAYNGSMGNYPHPMSGTNIMIFRDLTDKFIITSRVDNSIANVFLDHCTAGLSDDATDGYDSGIDVPKPMHPIDDYLSTYFPHGEWEEPLGPNFMEDFRNGNDDLSNAVKVYDFEVATDQVGFPVTTVFQYDYYSPWGIVLVDTDNDSVVNLRYDSNTYSFTAGASPRHFELHLGDGTAPEVTWEFPTEGQTMFAGETYSISWATQDVSPIAKVVLSYYEDNFGEWVPIDSTNGDPGSFEWTVPAEYFGQLDFELRVSDWAGNEEYTSVSAYAGPDVRDHEFSAGWHMFSIPLAPVDSSVSTIFSSFEDAYFAYSYHSSTGYAQASVVSSGTGYWLGTESAGTAHVEGDLLFESMSFPLDEGWNVVGNPYGLEFSLDWFYFFDHQENYYSYAEAVDAGVIGPAFYTFDNSQGSYQIAEMLEPWTGYWFKCLVPGLYVYYSPNFFDGGFDSYNGPVRDNRAGIASHGTTPPARTVMDVNNWSVNVVASMGNVSDRLGVIGVNEEAHEGYDSWYDVATPPTQPVDNVRLTFPHNEWNSPAGSSFSRDIRAPFAAGTTEDWNIHIEASQAGDLTLSFENIAENLPEGYWATLTINNNSVDIVANPTFTLAYTQPVDAVITVSNAEAGLSADDSLLPREFGMNAYPNPFNPTLNVSIAVPKASQVTAVVFDILGREVANLFNGTWQPGYHNLSWNADATSGIYFLKVTTNQGWSEIRKVTYLR